MSMKKFTLFLSAMLFSVMSFAGIVTFDADADKGNAGTDHNNATAYKITKDGVTVEVSSGILGTYNNEMHYRVYKNQTLKITSTVGNITKVEFTCTANGEAKYGPGCFTVSTGSYTNDGGAIGTWTGSATEIVFTASLNQVRATQLVVTIDGEGGETPDTPDTPDTPVTGTEITGIQGADATYVADEEFGDYWVFDLYASIDEAEGMYMSPYLYVETYEVYGKTTLNGTYNIYYAEYWKNENEEDLVNTDEMAEEPVGTLTIKNKDNNGNYSFVGSFVGLDGKTYTLNQVVPVTAYEYLGQDEDGYDIYEDLTLSENGSTPDTPDTPNTPDTPVAGAVTFDADVDKGNAGTDSNNATAYQVTKEGVTMEVSSGILGTYNNEMHYRIYKGQTLTLTSTAGNIVSVEFTCTAKDDEKYGPGNWTVDGGNYDYAGAVGTWTGDAASVVFTASTAQVRASQIVVKIAGGTTGVEDVTTIEIPVKVLKNGQVMILNGENVYNVLGAQVK